MDVKASWFWCLKYNIRSVYVPTFEGKPFNGKDPHVLGIIVVDHRHTGGVEGMTKLRDKFFCFY